MEISKFSKTQSQCPLMNGSQSLGLRTDHIVHMFCILSLCTTVYIASLFLVTLIKRYCLKINCFSSSFAKQKECLSCLWNQMFKQNNVHFGVNFKFCTCEQECSHLSLVNHNECMLAALAQMVACLPLAQQVWGSIPSGVANFHLKIVNLRARRGGDEHFLITRLYITGLD